MKLLGLTGGVGMGKSTVASLFRERGLLVVDTDQVARDVVKPGSPALAEIMGAFGGNVIDTAGRLHRRALAEMIFSDPGKRARLEGIVHPRIRAEWLRQVRQWADAGAAAAVVEIPLLFETGAQREFAATVCVACLHKTQATRLRSRGWPPLQIEQRIQAQWPIDEKLRLADHVVWTEGPIRIADIQVERILRAVLKADAQLTR